METITATAINSTRGFCANPVRRDHSPNTAAAAKSSAHVAKRTTLMRVCTTLNFAPQFGQAIPICPRRRPERFRSSNPGRTREFSKRANFQRARSGSWLPQRGHSGSRSADI